MSLAPEVPLKALDHRLLFLLCMRTAPWRDLARGDLPCLTLQFSLLCFYCLSRSVLLGELPRRKETTLVNLVHPFFLACCLVAADFIYGRPASDREGRCYQLFGNGQFMLDLL